MREPAFARIGPLAEKLVRELLPRLDNPFAFFGHSFGALVSYEVSRLLRERHARHPVCLFVSGCRAPHCKRRWVPMHELPESDLLDKLRLLGGTPNEALASAEVMRWALPALRADFAICESYTYTDARPLDCPISAFGGAEGFTTAIEEIVAWKEHTLAGFTYRLLPGGHFFLNTAGHALLKAMAHDLTVHLE